MHYKGIPCSKFQNPLWAVKGISQQILTDLVIRRIKVPSEAGSPNILEYEAGRISATDSTFRKRSQMTADLD